LENGKNTMAKQRVVNTKFWDDSYVARMSPNEKLVFLYLLTNPLTTIAGVYEISLKRAAFDIGLSMKEVGKVFDRLENDGKILREGDWLGIVNFIRHQSLNPKVRRGIEIELEKVPKSLIERIGIDFDSLFEPSDKLSHSNSNLNSNFNSNPNFKAASEEKLSTGYSAALEQKRRDLARSFRFR
jgi:hypothetical protein